MATNELSIHNTARDELLLAVAHLGSVGALIDLLAHAAEDDFDGVRDGTLKEALSILENDLDTALGHLDRALKKTPRSAAMAAMAA